MRGRETRKWEKTRRGDTRMSGKGDIERRGHKEIGMGIIKILIDSCSFLINSSLEKILFKKNKFITG